MTADHLAALGATLFISRLPATDNAGGRVLAEAVAQDRWEERGVLAHTQPTKPRPVAADKVAEGDVTLYGKPSRAVGVQSSTQEQRRLKRLAHAVQASYTTLQDAVRVAQKQDDFCWADAAAAAEQLQARQSAYHPVEVSVEERLKYGKGRPSTRTPRRVTERRYGLPATLRERAAVVARQRQAADCFVLRPKVPTAGPLAHEAKEVLRVEKDPHGVEPHFGCLKDPVSVNSRFLKKPERIEALGLVLLRSLMLWRLMERQLRQHVETAGIALTGGDKKATERPTSFMLPTKFAGMLVLKVGTQRQLARPLSAVPPQYLTALGLAGRCFTCPSG